MAMTLCIIPLHLPLSLQHPEHAQFLSYAPGPMPTAMFDTIRTSVSHEGTRQAFAAMSQTVCPNPRLESKSVILMCRGHLMIIHFFPLRENDGLPYLGKGY